MTQAPPATSKKSVPETFSLPPDRQAPGPSRWRLIWIGAAILVAIALFFIVRGVTATGPGPHAEDLVFTVKRENLQITVVESGSLESSNSIDIKSALEGRAQILRLVDEGARVRKGDLLCELDSSELVERETAQEISYERANASYVAAQKDHEISQSNGESDIKQAELNVYFADLDKKKYEEGDWPQQEMEAKANITIAEEELKRANDKEAWSRKLADKGFITRQELEADQLGVTKRDLDLQIARERLKVLRDYTYKKETERLRSDLEEAKKNLDRVKKRVAGQLVQSEADLSSKKATFELEKERLEKLRDQIRKAKVLAPQDGIVVYANDSSSYGRNNQDSIEEGASVRERQTILRLPDVTQMEAKIKIHESAYDRVSEGQKALITLDAFRDRVFPGRLTFVAPLPDSQTWWMNPDLKLYSANVKLGGDTTMLKPGMSCSVEIEVDNLEDVLYVPIQSVFREGKTEFCYVRKNGRIAAKAVTVGLHNDKLIHIVEGLEEGDEVLLAPPRSADKIKVPESDVDTEGQATELEFPEYEPESLGSGRESSLDETQNLPRSEMMKRFQNMSDEERREMGEKFRKQYENMTPEQREEAMKKWQGAGAGAPNQ